MSGGQSSAADDLALWDAAAAAYAASVRGDKDSFYRRIRGFVGERFGDVFGLDVLDLGCGHGWLAEELRVAGARVTGVDGSNALLAEARERYRHVTFVQHDLSVGLPKDLGRYDRVVAHMVLMDIAELDRLLADVAAALRPSGVFVFSILHPAFYSRAIVDDGPGGRYRKVPDYLSHEMRWVTSFGGHHHYHRPLSWYVACLVAHGLLVNGLHEPPSLPPEDVPESQWTDYQRWFSRIPTMLALSCFKAPASIA
jgi:2-polyprenyl-3-methyl-5-hydroxy-6-metoxy-1,4-benzoquinol methylase